MHHQESQHQQYASPGRDQSCTHNGHGLSHHHDKCAHDAFSLTENAEDVHKSLKGAASASAADGNMSTPHKQKDIQTENDADQTYDLIQARSLLKYEDRFADLKQIYNDPMSPTIIYLAHDREIGKDVVLKKVLKVGLTPAVHEQALREQEVAISLKHFNIVQTYFVTETDTEFAVAMEVVRDADYLQEKLTNPPRSIKNETKLKLYMYDILQGLDYLHKSGYIHLDIKPANLFCWRQTDDMDEIRRVKIADFGLARKVGADGSVLINEQCGTYGFIAPEVKPKAHVTAKADIWSLGITLYLMAVAYMPHYMKGYKYGEGEVPFRQFDWKRKSPQLLAFAKRLLQIDPNLRPTAEECLRDPFFEDYEEKSALLRRGSNLSRSTQFSHASSDQ